MTSNLLYRKFDLVLIGILLIGVAKSNSAIAQHSIDEGKKKPIWNFNSDKKEKISIASIVEEIFVPQFIIDAGRIRNYVKDERFQLIRKWCGDKLAVDAIFLKSLKITEYNINRALFISLLAVLDHKSIAIKMPFRAVVNLPLTFESDSNFKFRLNHLPKKIYFDSPDNLFGDRDKIQHFFGSAYVSYIFESPELATAFGNGLEWLEERIVVDGKNDARDKRANKQGAVFGDDLLFDKCLLPSKYFDYYEKDN